MQKGPNLMENKKKVWIFSFEYAGVAKVGGLGEVPANQAKQLAEEFDITVFMPSHGQLEGLKNKYKLEKLPFKCVGQINPSLFGSEQSEANCAITFYKFSKENVNIILLSGENSFTSKYLDDKTVYNPTTIRGKIALFSLGIRCLVNYFLENYREKIPEIVHLHDYHVVLGYLGMKQALTKRGLEITSILTIHLLTWPRFEYEFYKLSGVDDTPVRVLMIDGFKMLSLREIFLLSQENNGYPTDHRIPTVEKIGAIISDLVTTVSQSYLMSDIIPNCGNELIEFKADFIWDGCDWDYFEIFDKIVDRHGSEILEILKVSYWNEINEAHMKEFLLKYKLGNLSQGPLINSQNVLNAINEISNGNPFIKNGNIKAFTDSGPLVLTTGRISPQKGFDIIFKAIPEVLKVIPNAKFLFLILPTDYSLNEIRIYSDYVKQYPENVRIIFGVASEIFYLAHICADVYCALSRWEPFGIMALEAMACKIPIIATRVGGLQETIIDASLYPKIGTGFLIEKDNPFQFVKALISILKSSEVAQLVKISENHTIYDADTLNIANQIPDEIIKAHVLLNPSYFFMIKENCYKRVKENFTWSIVSRKLAQFYRN
ncbi:MAG: glycosyltransferase [Candidatus Lokiarchaeota archaeon]|nr:glycosyltransferase [Candidatus Lokiarchaeota archaeon]